MAWAFPLIVVVASIGLFFWWSNRFTAQRHARFGPKDAEEAMVELVSPDARDHDTWDLFLAWPIDDPYLESIRRRCVAIVQDSAPKPAGTDSSEELKAAVTALLEELRNREQMATRPHSTPIGRGAGGSTTV